MRSFISMCILGAIVAVSSPAFAISLGGDSHDTNLDQDQLQGQNQDQGQAQGQAQGQLQGQGQGQAQGQTAVGVGVGVGISGAAAGAVNDGVNSSSDVSVDASSHYDAPKIPVNSAAPVFAGSCSQGMSAQAMGFGGSIASGNPVCDYVAIAGARLAAGQAEAAHMVLDKAEKEADERAAFGRARRWISLGLF